ncbi:twin-arginine translocase TatA/TatE family subunit [Edaphobacter paludis]|uniref:Twin-arginine translocase TatA/TatE family subunit n=1 Tax=Edaphobacter paludis TaxID=3035702 RepID=A0AAU7D0V2_9BACT
MPSFQDSALIFVLALLLFGPKKLPELARQLGKLMGEFRRASNEFRMQMEDELRQAEQADQQKKIAAMEAAAPVTPVIPDDSENPIEEHPHMDPFKDDYSTESIATTVEPISEINAGESNAEPAPEPLPIATSGELNLMPPSTGLPVASSSISQAFNSIPRAPEPGITPEPAPDRRTTEASLHG